MFDDGVGGPSLSRAYPQYIWALQGQNAEAISPVMLPGALTVITDIDIYSYGSLSSTTFVQFTTTDLDVTFAQFTFSGTNPSSQQWRGWQVVSPGLQIGFGILTGTWDFRISGWVYPAPGWTPF